MNEFSSGGQPPCNIELEQALLGAILCDNEVLAGFSLEPRHFFDPLHARIFEVAAGRINEGRLSTSVTLRSAFAAEEPVSDEVTAVQYLERLETGAAYDAVKNTSEYALQIKELAAYREIIAISMTAEQMARESRVAPGELAVEAIAQLDDVIAAHRIARKTSFSIDAAAKEALERATSPDTDPPVTTGFKSLDDRIGGFYRGEFSLLAGRPSMGKSAVSVSIGLKAAKARHNVLYFSLEMTAEAFGGRCLTDEAWHRDDPIAYKDLRRGGLSEPVVRRLYYDGLKKLEGVPLYIDEQPGLRISEIISRSRRHHQFLEKSGGGLGLVIIDHLGKIRPSSRYAGNNYGERSEISAALAEMAKSLNVPVLALHQLSRAVEQREDKRPLMSDLRDSGRLEEDADNIMFVYRDAYYLERLKHDDPTKEASRLSALDTVRNQLEIIVAKQRAGQTGAPVTLFADMQSNAIRDLAIIERGIL